MNNSREYDVIIVGAGPAGTACALGLKDSGLKVLLTDKQNFPRDKVCGDAIPNRAVKVLKHLSEKVYSELQLFTEKAKTSGCRVVAPNKKQVDISFRLEGYISARMSFDNFLFEMAKQHSSAGIMTDQEIKQISCAEDFVEVKTTQQNLRSAVVVGCDGAHSIVEKQTTGLNIDHRHYTGAVRAYYKNIAGTLPGMMEIHLLKEFPSAYFWIFPLHDGVSNVGLGMLSETISKTKTNLRKSLLEITGNKNFLGNRFNGALLVDEPRGFGLPMGSRKVQMSGHRLLLCGDAASLIDPATGEGIGNAMFSGMLAAKQIEKCFAENNFSAGFMRQYDNAVYGSLEKELKSKYFLQRLIGNRPWLVNAAVSLASHNAFVKNYFQKLF